MNRARIAAIAKLAGVNLFLFALLVVGLELAFGEWFSDYFPPYGAIFNRTFTYEQHFYDPPSSVTYVRDQYGLRGASAPVNEIDLVTVGGSTTDQRFITEGATWQDVMHTMSGIRIANAGVDGLSSSGHVVAVTDWLHRIPNFHPRYYLHYIGVNDALYVHYLPLNEPSARAKVLALLQRQVQPRSFSRILRARSVFVRTYLRLTAWIVGPPVVGSNLPSVSTMPPEVAVEVSDAPMTEYIESIYRPNLHRLIQLHQQNGEHAILVSQPGHPSFFTRKGTSVFVRSKGMEVWAVALRMINDTTQAVCREHAANCSFIDLARELPLEADDFYDFVHATPAGARRIGTFLAQKLSELRRADSF